MSLGSSDHGVLWAEVGLRAFFLLDVYYYHLFFGYAVWHAGS